MACVSGEKRASVGPADSGDQNILIPDRDPARLEFGENAAGAGAFKKAERKNRDKAEEGLQLTQSIRALHSGIELKNRNRGDIKTPASKELGHGLGIARTPGKEIDDDVCIRDYSMFQFFRTSPSFFPISALSSSVQVPMKDRSLAISLSRLF